jgi:uncharacterized sulfatase
MRARGALLLALVAGLPGTGPAAAAEGRPNILWITCEDISPDLGCYGVPGAITPNLDGLARQGVRYSHAFTVAGVCAPSRSCLITGMYPSTLGSQHMRCQTNLPAFVKCFPAYLRAAGYYCSNNAKQDYNFATPPGSWDESSRTAHWRKRRPGQPFFSVFNLLVSHESQIRTPEPVFRKRTARLSAAERHDPGRVRVPPWHPDTPVVRRDWARYHDLITAMDKQAGDLLRQLAEDGLADDTIVFFFSDHGAGLPRAKRWLYDAGLRVPLLIRFPKRFAHLAPAKPGSVSDRLVSFVDFAPTILSLAGVKAPEHMQGGAFLGKAAGKPREVIFGIRDRMDERPDFSRCVRDRRYKYIRNYLPQRPWAQVIEYMEEMPTMQEWRRLAAAGKLSGPAGLFLRPSKPFEELYDTEADPHEVRNLAGLKEHREVLERLRRLHLAWLKETRDLSFLPEAELRRRSRGSTPYEMGKDDKKYPQERILAAALACQAAGDVVPKLRELLRDEDSAVRWWAATGLGVRGAKAPAAVEALRRALADPSAVVRVAAADGLRRLGRAEEALPVLTKALRDEDEWVRHAAVVALDEMGPAARPALAALRTATKDGNGFVVRVARHAVKELGEKGRE